MKKQGYHFDQVLKIIKEVFEDDEEYQNRVNNVVLTFNKENIDIAGWNVLKKYIPKVAQEKLLELTRNHTDDTKIQIVRKLAKHKQPSVKLVANFCNSKMELYRNPNTLKYYELLEDSSFKEINENRIINFLNKELGVNQISSSTCEKVLEFIRL